MSTLAHNVHRGAQLLDEKMPVWFQKIDLDKLCMSDGTVCVLGQLFAEQGGRVMVDGFTFGMDLLDWSDEEGGLHGFSLYGNNGDWQELDRLWMAEVKARFDEGFEV